MRSSMRRRRRGAVVIVVALVTMLAAPATAGVEPSAEELEAEQVRAFLQELFAGAPGEAGEWEWEPAPPADREVRFPSGETLPVVAGPVGPDEEHYDPNEAGLPLLDVSGDHRDTELAPDITAGELARSGRERFDVARIDPNLVACLQRIRSAFDEEEVRVRSGYRSHAYNVALYEARGEEPTDSEHSSGRAMDLVVEGMTGLEVAKAAVEVCGCDLGVGIGDDYAHVDVRGEDSQWSYLDAGPAEEALDEDPAEEALDALAAHREEQCGTPEEDDEDADEDVHEHEHEHEHDATEARTPTAPIPVGMTPGGLLAASDEVVEGLRDALAAHEFADAVELAVANGLWDENQLTDIIFFVSHPELRGRQLREGEHALGAAWLRLRDEIVRPAIEDLPPYLGLAASLADPPGPVRGTSWLRQAWDGHACEDEFAMLAVDVLGNGTRAHPLTVEALGALDAALSSTGYEAGSVGIYNCRDINGRPGQLSLHAYGLAVDLDPGCHPHRVGDPGPARFSPAANQDGRCRDVQAGFADTAFTPEQIEAVERIRTVDGLQVFTWGGRWRASPDAMHFQINVSPEELLRGIG